MSGATTGPCLLATGLGPSAGRPPTSLKETPFAWKPGGAPCRAGVARGPEASCWCLGRDATPRVVPAAESGSAVGVLSSEVTCGLLRAVSRSQAGLSISPTSVPSASLRKFLDHGLALLPARLDSGMPRSVAAGPCRPAHRALGLAQEQTHGVHPRRARQRAPPVCVLVCPGPPVPELALGPQAHRGGHPLPRGEGRAVPGCSGTAELPFEALFTAGGPAVGTRAQGPSCHTRAGRAWHEASLRRAQPSGQGRWCLRGP